MRKYLVLLALSLLAPLGACDDGTNFRIDPILASDTVELAVPGVSADAPTALDVTAVGGIIFGGRFPERQTDAESFDFVLRRRGGELVLVPGSVLGLLGPNGRPSDAAITQPMQGQTFDALIEAPGRAAFVTDSAVVLRPGAVYVARSRTALLPGIGLCQQYAKLQPLAVDAAAGRASVRLTTNERCGDPRLALED